MEKMKDTSELLKIIMEFEIKYNCSEKEIIERIEKMNDNTIDMFLVKSLI